MLAIVAILVGLIYRVTLSDVAKSLTSSGDVTVALSSESAASSLIGFEAGGRRTTSTLVDGEYPPVRRLFPDTTAITAVVWSLVGLPDDAALEGEDLMNGHRWTWHGKVQWMRIEPWHLPFGIWRVRPVR